MLELFLGLSFQQRKRVWVEVSQHLGCTSIEAHDYFYNTWQQQFYESLKPFGEELK